MWYMKKMEIYIFSLKIEMEMWVEKVRVYGVFSMWCVNVVCVWYVCFFYMDFLFDFFIICFFCVIFYLSMYYL